MIRRTTHNDGIKVPNSLKYTDDIDIMNKSTFWQDAIAKEMKSIGIPFDMLENGQVIPVRHKRTSGYKIFDIKMNFTRNSRWELDRHKNLSHEGSAHTGVVPRESVRIFLLM